MSQSGRSHKPEAAKKPAEELDPKYVPGESSPLSDPMRGVRAQREQASAQIAHTLKVWRKAEAEPAPEEEEKKEAEGGEQEGEEKAEEPDEKKANGKEGEKKDGEEAKEGEEAKGADEGKEQEGEDKVQRKVFLAKKDGTPGNNQAQNKQFDDAVKAIEKQIGRKLSKDEVRKLHDAITGQNLGFHEIVEEGLGMFKK